MNRPILSLLAATAIHLMVVSPAGAQAPAAPAAAGLGGTAIAGLCLLSREAVFANAKVGVAVSAQLKTLSEQAQAEVDAERKPIEEEIKAFQAAAATLTPDQRKARETALAPKLEAVQSGAQQRSRELEAARAKAMAQIAAETQPVISAAYAARKCGLLIDRTTVLGGNLSNDITAAVVQGLDAKVTTLKVERVKTPATSG